MSDLRTAAQQALETCPFCGNEPRFSGNASIWQDEARYVELSLGCCVSMTEQIGWRRARDMTHEAKTAELQNRLRLKWNARAALEQPEQAEPMAWIEHGLVEAPDGLVWEKRSVGYYTPLYTHPPRREPEPPPEPISDAKIRAEFRDLDRHTLPGDMTLEDWFEAGVRFAERQHEIV